MWDPTHYLHFADHRSRPFHELLARIDLDAPRRVVDLGCGPGTLTAILTSRWPDAVVEACDSSPEMVQAAIEAGIDAQVQDLSEWVPKPDTDVVISNAVLHWVPGHVELLRRWVAQLGAGTTLAVQVPGNFGFPSHMLIRQLAGSAKWRDRLGAVTLRDENAVRDAQGYAEILTDAGATVDAWETTYLQRLGGDDPVLDWVSGTALRPVRAALDDGDWNSFRADLAPLLRQAYPPQTTGSDGYTWTWFPFRRIFFVAVVG